MEDSRIVQLYWDREQDAISATAEKYGSYCSSIARNILGNQSDAEECVNDAYLSAWNAMPPHRPAVLSAFLGKLTRNAALNRWERNTAEKRGGGQLPAVLEELSDCVSGGDSVEQAMDRQALAEAINAFLETLPAEKRNIFICRYWYADRVSDIARRYRRREGAISMTLNRLRLELRGFLLERGFDL